MRIPCLALLIHLHSTNNLVSARLGIDLDSSPDALFVGNKPVLEKPIVQPVFEESIVGHTPDNLTDITHDDDKPVVGDVDSNFSFAKTRMLPEYVQAGSAEAPLIFNRSDHLMSGLTYEDLYEDPYNTSEPGYDATQDPFSINFHAYQNQDVIEPWMIDLLRGMYHVRMEDGVHQPLCLNEKLVRMAKAHILDIVDQELLLSHIGTDGKDSGARIDDIGYDMTSYGATVAATECTDVNCALINRPLYFTKQNKYNQLGIAKEEYDEKGNPRWYFVFTGTETEPCFGMDVTQIDWPEGTPTMAPVPEPLLPPIIPGDGGELIEDWMIGFLSLLNAERNNEGVGDLCFNKKLILTAQAHNQDQVDNNFMGHYGSDGSTPALRAVRQGYVEQKYMSENCAAGQWTIKDCMYAWMSSKGQHAQNIVNPSAKHIGLARDTVTGTYTLVFGDYLTPAERCISTVQCESTTSYLEDVDPTYSKYTCSLCLENDPYRQFGVMGCGFGMEWYHKNSLEDYMRRA